MDSGFAVLSCAPRILVSSGPRTHQGLDISGWDIHDTIYSRELLISNKANGYRDILATIDFSTYRRIPWENNVPFFLVSFLDPDTKEPVVVDPRGILKITTQKAETFSRSCYAGVEYEVLNLLSDIKGNPN